MSFAVFPFQGLAVTHLTMGFSAQGVVSFVDFVGLSCLCEMTGQNQDLLFFEFFFLKHLSYAIGIGTVKDIRSFQQTPGQQKS